MNNASGILRKLVILLTTLIILVVFLIIFQFTDVAFRVWDRLQQTPGAFLAVYLAGVALIAAIGGLLLFRIWTAGRGKKPEKPASVPLSLENVRERAASARAQGVDTSLIDADLQALDAPDEAATLEVAFFGKISTGKSSLIRTLLPDAHIETSVIGGSTASTQRYSYETGGLTLTLLDMPGTHQAQQLASMEESLIQIVRRVHLVVYVLDQDMTDSDVRAIDSLHGFGKPLIVALNKANRYREADLAALKARIRQRLPADVRFVVTASAYPQEVQRVQADGTSARETRLYRGDVAELLAAFADLGARRADLSRAQQQALLALASDNLSLALRDYRRERGEAMVKAYARKAMLGGVAAVGPGTDILIQGYLGMDMVKALTKLYDVPVRDVDVQHLIEQASGKVKSQLTLILALAGNICKAFPGLGTVLGGASHAVAYGLIFESLGRAALAALEHSDGGINTQSIMNYFEDELQHDLEKRAKNLVRTVLERG